MNNIVCTAVHYKLRPIGQNSSIIPAAVMYMLTFSSPSPLLLLAIYYNNIIIIIIIILYNIIILSLITYHMYFN